jgi:demethoxyubiquinone hydroxylase (CLK1/Coq7/Cat5 family)
MSPDAIEFDVQKSIDTLNSLLRHELAAVESYGKALKQVEGTHHEALERCQESHERRVAVITQHITSLGGEPVVVSGLWGSLANAITAGSGLLGEKAVIAALEEGEDLISADYRKELEQLDPLTAHFVSTELISEQARSHDALSELKRWLI